MTYRTIQICLLSLVFSAYVSGPVHGAADLYDQDYSVATSHYDHAPVRGLKFMKKAGTLGTGLELDYDVSKTISMRIENYTYDHILSHRQGFVSSNFDLDLDTTSLLLDWHPFGASFHATIGLSFNRHRINGTAFVDEVLRLPAQHLRSSEVSSVLQGLEARLGEPGREFVPELHRLAQQLPEDASIDLPAGQVNLDALGQINGVLFYPSVAPYLGIGWSTPNTSASRFRYSVDIGVIYHGQPDIQLNLEGPVAEVADRYSPGEVSALIAIEQDKILAEFKDFKFFPVISVGMVCRF